MISERTKWSFAFIVLFFIQSVGFSQIAGEVSKFQAKYSGNSVISEIKSREIELEFDKDGIPETRTKDFNSLFVLADNAQAFAESKEYFIAKASLESFRAYNRVPDGKKYKDLPVKNLIKSTEINDGLFYDDSYVYSFSYPSVMKGSRLVTESETIIKDPYYPIIFNFGGSIPYDSSVLSITAPASVRLCFHLFGSDTSSVRFSKTTKGKRITYQWKTTNLGSYSDDDNSPSFLYFTPHIIVHIAGFNENGKYRRIIETIDDLYNWHSKNISRMPQVPSNEITHLSDSLTKNLELPDEKARVIFRWVQENIKYIAIEDGDNGFIPREASLVLKRRYGDCKDKSSLLKAMLCSVGLDASLAWVGTRHLPYLYSTFPSMSNDDHMICVWWAGEDNPVVLDGTTRNHSLDQTPAFIQGKESIVERGPANYKLIKIPVRDASANTISDSIRIRLENEKLKGQAESVIQGERKAQYISHIESTEPVKYKDIIPGLFQFASNKFQASNVRITDLQLIDQPLKIKFDFEIPDYTTIYKNATYVNMNIERLFQDLALKADRHIPFENNFCFKYSIVCILDIPSDMTVMSIPDPSSFQHPKFSFLTKYTLTKNQVILSNEITINFLTVSGDEYAEFFNMLNKLNQEYIKSIVLIKN